MSMTRRSLAATALPALLIGAMARQAVAKSAGPEQEAIDACVPGDASKRCVAAKARWIADDGEHRAGCPYCAGRDADKP